MSSAYGAPALDFLATSPRLSIGTPRWGIESVQAWCRLAKLSVMFLFSYGVWLALSDDFQQFGWGLLAAALGSLGALELGRAARLDNRRFGALGLAALSTTLSALPIAIVSTSFHDVICWLVYDGALMLAVLLAWQLSQAWMFRTLETQGRLSHNLAVVGTPGSIGALIRTLESSDARRRDRLACYVADKADLAHSGILRGDLAMLLSDARLGLIDAIVVAPDRLQPAFTGMVRAAMLACVQDIYVVGDATPGAAASSPVSVRFDGVGLELVQRRPIAGRAAARKRAFDVIGACVLLAVMAPLLVLLAMAIRVDTRGPILFRQLRVGYNNRLFYIYKFRSMHANEADALARQQTVRGDKRVTRVGRVIRKLSLDELPQLLNVLRGEMSLVGPRPHAPGTSIGGQRVHTMVEEYACRHLVRPGITGLAQVRGLRGGLQDRKQVVDRIASDLEYTRRWSLWLDVRILLGTVLLELRDSRGI